MVVGGATAKVTCGLERSGNLASHLQRSGPGRTAARRERCIFGSSGQLRSKRCIGGQNAESAESARSIGRMYNDSILGVLCREVETEVSCELERSGNLACHWRRNVVSIRGV